MRNYARFTKMAQQARDEAINRMVVLICTNVFHEGTLMV